MNIILYLLNIIQEQRNQIAFLLSFICKYIPVKQWVFDDSHSPKYQKFKVDRLPTIIPFEKQDYQFLLQYYLWKYKKPLKPVSPHKSKPRLVPEDTVCPRCGAPHSYLYDNNGGNGQYQCKVCKQTFITGQQVTTPLSLRCPYCAHMLVASKTRKNFVVHKCVNSNCSYFKSNVRKLPKDFPKEQKYLYKLHYIYREFTVDFFAMDLHSLPKNATSFSFKKFSPHILGLVLTYHVNLKLSTRQTSHALKDIHGIDISHTTVANYAMSAAAVIKPFVDTFDYKPSNIISADETYIKKLGIKHYVWIIMDACKKSILGYQVSDTRSTGPCILAMRMAFEKFKDFPSKALRFVADGYSAYPLAAQHCKQQKNYNLLYTILKHWFNILFNKFYYIYARPYRFIP